MRADDAGGYRAPLGCRDPKLWAAAAELLAMHDADATCTACRAGAPCTLLRSCLEAQERAMEPFTIRWLRGDDYVVAQISRRSAGRTRVRQCTARAVSPRWRWPDRAPRRPRPHKR